MLVAVVSTVASDEKNQSTRHHAGNECKGMLLNTIMAR